MPVAGGAGAFLRRLFVAVAGIGAHLANILTKYRLRFWRLGQDRAAAFAMAEFGKIEGIADGAFHRFGFRRLAAAAVGIAGPTHKKNLQS